MSYAPISKNGVDAAEPLFDEPAPAPAFPRIVLHTTIVYDGFTFDVTFNDTSIGDAVTVLKRRGCAPAQPVAGEPPAAETPGTMPQADIPPSCPVHHKPMKAMKFPNKKTGEKWMCTARDDDGFCQERA